MPEIIVGRDDEDSKKYGKTATLNIGKHIVGTGEEAHLTTPVLLDVLRPHIIALTGKRGSGKSYTLLTIVEEITKLPEEARHNLCSLVIDTQGIFWTIKSPNEKDAGLLAEWKLQPQGFSASVYVPEGQEKIFRDAGVEFDSVFSISPSELSAEEWVGVFNFEPADILSIMIQKIISQMRKPNYSIEDIIDKVKEQQGFEKEKLALENYFLAAKSWGIFGNAKMPDILVPEKTTILDVSLTPQNVRSLLLSIVSKKVYIERTKERRREELSETENFPIKRKPLCWIFIDEAHNFLPAEGTAPSLDILLRIVKEGRQPGVSLVLATQRPNKLHPDALAQTDMVISHRLTAKNDIDSLKEIMQTYLLYDIGKYINDLPHLKGTAIVLDDNSERLYKIRIRPRQSWHAGSSPTVI